MSEANNIARLGHTGTTKTPTGVAAEEGYIVKLDRTGKIPAVALDTVGILEAGFKGEEFQVANAIAPAALPTLLAGSSFAGQDPGGGPGVEGIISTPPDNVVFILDAKNDEYLDAAGNKVYGRVTEATIALTGAVTFTNGVATVAGVGTLFLAEVLPGDTVQLDADGVYATVFSVTSNILLTLTGLYGGAGGSGSGSRRRWTLSFFSNIAAVETPYAGFAGGETLKLFPLKVFNLSNIPVVSGRRTLPFDQVAGDIPLATTTLAGKVVLSPDGGTTPGEVVQADDSRLFKLNTDVVPPTATDDSAAGYRVGDWWLDTVTSTFYRVSDVSVGFAVWFIYAAPPTSVYLPTNVTPDTAFDADATTVDELADVLGTVIADLQARGILG
jgi:hypothetical protein